MFSTREDAGRQLGAKLLSGHYKADLVVGLGRGGVAVLREISKMMGIPHAVLVVKKIGSPGNPELAIGAVVPAGQTLDVRGKSIIVTDDGIATGETMKTAIDWAKSQGVQKILVAIPVGPPDVIARLQKVSDVVVLETPSDFGAVGEFYKNFPQLTDKDVVELLS